MDTLYFDGCCPGGVTAWGWVLVRDGREVAIGHGTGERGTINEAEYRGLIAALEANPQRPLLVYGDSQLVVYQVLGRYATRKAHLVPLRDRARVLLNGARLRWVPGQQNRADGPSRTPKLLESEEP